MAAASNWDDPPPPPVAFLFLSLLFHRILPCMSPPSILFYSLLFSSPLRPPQPPPRTRFRPGRGRGRWRWGLILYTTTRTQTIYHDHLLSSCDAPGSIPVDPTSVPLPIRSSVPFLFSFRLA